MLHGFRTKVISIYHSLRTKHSDLAGEIIFRSSSSSFSHLLSHQSLKHSPSKSSLLCCSSPTTMHKVFSSGAHIHTVFPLKYPLIACKDTINYFIQRYTYAIPIYWPSLFRSVPFQLDSLAFGDLAVQTSPFYLTFLPILHPYAPSALVTHFFIK